MKVKEVIDKCIELLDVDYTKEDLLECFNVIENELALDYLPLYHTHKCNSTKVYYTELEYNPVRIVSCNCKFKLYPEFITSKEVITEVVYSYTPNAKTMYDECSYDEKFLNCLTYGMITEYFIRQGFFEEAILWGRRYKNELQAWYDGVL